jgi:hypothetical protein
MKAKRSKSRFFIGIFPRAVSETVKVAGVLTGAPAALEIKLGDLIISVNGKSITSTKDLSESLLRSNYLEIRRSQRTKRVHVRAVNVANEAEVVELLLGKGDKVAGLGRIYLAKHCDSKCQCVDSGRACEIWYTFEGKGKNGGVLLKQHCKSLDIDPDTLKTKWVERKCPGGPKEYF